MWVIRKKESSTWVGRLTHYTHAGLHDTLFPSVRAFLAKKSSEEPPVY